MILYYSGTSGEKVDPEMTLGDAACVMLSFYDSSGLKDDGTIRKECKLQPRTYRIFKERKKKHDHVS